MRNESSNIFLRFRKRNNFNYGIISGLGRYLRAVGFDTIILNNRQTHDICCRYAQSGRKVVTKGAAYYEVFKMLNTIRFEVVGGLLFNGVDYLIYIDQ